MLFGFKKKLLLKLKIRWVLIMTTLNLLMQINMNLVVKMLLIKVTWHLRKLKSLGLKSNQVKFFLT